MASIVSSVKQLVNENSVNNFMKASEILIRFADNILKNPNEPKFRRIRLSNPTVSSKLLPVSGALECLFEMGFAEDGEYLSLPHNFPLSVLTEIRTQLDHERTIVLKATSPPVNEPLVPNPTVSQSQASGCAADSNKSSAEVSGQHPVHIGIIQKEEQFYRKLEAQIQHVQVYEDRRLQQLARDVIPVAELEAEAKQRLENLNQVESDAEPSSHGDSGQKLDIRDCLILALLNWFKKSFFRWVDAPACKTCGGKTTNVGMIEPTADELLHGGNRVENYKCERCNCFTKFVRYNSPAKLLHTREGRCGEWANCFTLCCRALGFEARYVLDWTDHVWTEVYSNSQQRWVHCDSCENACDKPLIYEVGWGKKLTYVIAFSTDDIEDVTWRYTTNFKEILKRRNECRENWLVKTIFNLDKLKWSAMPEAKKNMRLKRKVVELVEFLTPKTADGQNLSGRTSGSLAWRLERGELGNQPAKVLEPYTFKLTEQEIAEKYFHVGYSCAKDEYSRPSANDKKVSGFLSWVNSSENMFRKLEHDWKMTYLARTEGSNEAKIAWQFDFSDSRLVIDKLEIKKDDATYENGKVKWVICFDEQCISLTGGPALQIVPNLKGQTKFTLTATLTGGKGSVAWQHTQLFRQSVEDSVVCPLEIKVTLL